MCFANNPGAHSKWVLSISATFSHRFLSVINQIFVGPNRNADICLVVGPILASNMSTAQGKYFIPHEKFNHGTIVNSPLVERTQFILFMPILARFHQSY